MGFGAIQSVRCLTHKGFAFLEFATTQFASAALAAGIREVAGFPVVVKWAHSKNSTGMTPGGKNNNNSGQHDHPHQRGSTVRSSAPSLENRPLAAASDPTLWHDPSATQGTVIPPAPPGLRAFLSPEATQQRPPQLFPIPTFEQAQKLYPSMRHSVRTNW